MTVTFRQATENDLEGIVNLCNECFYEKTTLAYASKIFEQTKYDPNQIYIIGELEGQIISHTRIAIVPTIFEEMNTFAILNHICVKPEFRKHNIATHMLDAVTKVCQARGCIALKLWSNNVRKPAHACYKKYGFVVDDAAFFSKKIKKEV